ncbi:MAG: PAS domain S-box protein, partial [Gammaproteobacteria bacterium]|nr:PAS domain S-box protein [Gammaproteobacteria bacterium]
NRHVVRQRLYETSLHYGLRGEAQLLVRKSLDEMISQQDTFNAALFLGALILSLILMVMTFTYVRSSWQREQLYHEVGLRKDVEDRLRGHEQHLSMLFRNMADGIIATDQTGVITQMNPAAERFTGWQSHEAQGHEIQTVLQLEDSEGRVVPNPAQQLISGKEQERLRKSRLVNRRGGSTPVGTIAGAIYHHDNQLMGVIITLHPLLETETEVE